MKEVNTSYYQQLLDKGRFDTSDRNFYQKILNSVKKQGGKATDRQYNIIQQIKFGKPMYSSKNEHIYNKKLNIMESTNLRQLIRESIQEYIKEIDAAGNRAALEAKMAKTQEAIDKRKKLTAMEGLDEAYQEYLDERKMKEMTSEIKLLEKSMGKYKKMLEKMDAKDTPKMEEMKDTDEEIIDEVSIDETFPESGPQLEEAKMTKTEKAKKEDIVKGIKKSKSFGKSKEGKSEMYATATKLAMKESTETEGEVLNKQFLHMQKLAGLITETQYKQKLKETSFEYEDDELTLAYNNAPKTLPWDTIEKAYQESGLSGEEFFAGYETEFRKQFEGKPVSKEAYFKFYEDRATGGQDDRYAMFNWISFSNPEDFELVRRLSDMI